MPRKTKLGLRVIPGKGPIPNPTPRRAATLKSEHQRFAYEYVLNGAQPADAYEAVYGKQSERIVAQQSAYRILRRADVMELIDKLQCDLLDKTAISVEWVIIRWKLLYFASMKRKDMSTAYKALDAIAKHLGLYEKHNRQKVAYSQADVDRLKDELTQAGFDLTKLEPSEN